MSDLRLPPRVFKGKERIWRALESFFWNTLCCTPDSNWRIFHWWYRVTGNIARYFHKRHCAYCLDTRSRPWKTQP